MSRHFQTFQILTIVGTTPFCYGLGGRVGGLKYLSRKKKQTLFPKEGKVEEGVAE